MRLLIRPYPWIGSFVKHTAEISADAWNQVYMDLSGWSGRSNITKIEISFRAVGSSSTWYGSRFQIDMIRAVMHDQLENEVDMIELSMQPFWQGTTMYQESVLMVSHAGERPEADLLFTPNAIVCVKSARLDQEYEENVDWVLENGTLKLTPTSRIPYLTDEELYFSDYTAGVTMPKKGGGAVLYQEGSYFHDRQIVVSYTHAENLWSGPVPQLADSALTATFAKLRNQEPLRIVLYGDSISVGANSSGFTNVPPHLPIWGQLVADALEAHYGSAVTFINESVGGTTSQWGAEQAASRAAVHHPDLAIIAFGMNDGSGTGAGDGTAPAVYKNNILSIINSVRAVNPQAEFILVGPTLPNAETIFFDQQPYYYAKLEEIANTVAGVAAANLTGVHSELLNHKAFLDMTGNNINHTNDFLTRWYAQFITGMLKDHPSDLPGRKEITMLTVTELTCEYRNNPLGLDEMAPRVSWKLCSDQRNTLQTGYQLQVSLSRDFDTILWDTGTVSSDQSVHVAYEGPALSPRRRYYYRVRAADNHGNRSAWSAPSFWETGMLYKTEWCAQWISSGCEEETLLEASPLLRRAFRLEKSVASARAYVTALGLYFLYVNGERVGADYFTPGWTSYAHRQQYQTYDVTSMLQSGDNVVGAVLGNGWYAGYIAWSGEKGFYGKKRAFLLQIHIRFTDGSEQVVISDGSWRSKSGPIRMSEIYHGETYDAAQEEAGWCLPGYVPSGWHPVEVLDHSMDNLVAQENEPPRIMQEIKPQQLLTTPAGETVLDFGQNMVGFVRFTVRGRPGDVVVLRHGEVLDRDGNFYTENLKGARQTIVYKLKGSGVETYQPHFTFQGFRYVCIDSYPGEIRPDYFTGCVVHSALTQTGSFTCSHPMVNQLQHNILWGQKGNFVDVPTDCPQRDERHGWTGDAQMFLRTACFNMNVALFYKKWLRDLASDQTDAYGVPNVIPNVRDSAYGGSAGWGDAATICPWTLYLCYGDSRVLSEQYTSMKRWVEYIRRQGSNPFLWNTGEHFGDWLALDNGAGSWIGKTPTDFIATAFYANSTKLLAQTAERLGYSEDAAAYHTLYSGICAQFRQEFVTSDGQLTADTQTAYVLALMFDLLPAGDRGRAADRLAALIHKNQDHLNTGFVGTPYLCHVLSKYGHHNLACRLLLQTDCPSWLYPITKGATTIWEHWDGIREDNTFWDAAMNSFNHYAYGSIGDWLYRVLAGLNPDPDAPGYQHIRICPKPGDGFTSANVCYQSPYGRIVSEWRIASSRIEVHLTIPVNTSATVTLPHASLDEMRSENLCTDLQATLTVPVQKPDGVQFKIGSGTYRFVYRLDLENERH